MYNPDETDEQRRNREAFERGVAAVDRFIKKALPHAGTALAVVGAIAIIAVLAKK